MNAHSQSNPGGMPAENAAGSGPAAERTTCTVIGGGPAGMVVGLLLARAGVSVTVFEKHGDFLRDFRGDTVHPSTMQLLADLGLYDTFATLPRGTITSVDLRLADGESVTVADFHRLRHRFPFIAMVPQWDLLNLLADAGNAEPTYTLRMSTEVTGLIRDAAGRVTGVQYTGPEGAGALRSDLTIACDGRTSLARLDAGLVPHEYGMNFDVWWFRLPASTAIVDSLLPRVARGIALVLIPRQGYIQAARLIPKGADAALRARGIGALRREIVDTVPELAANTELLTSMDDVALLDARLNRLRRWHTDGLLCIGDAAHAMSPVGGVGINLAVQDAVAAARLLARPLLQRRVTIHDLAAVARRRRYAVSVTQLLQRGMHAAIGKVLGGGDLTLPRPVGALLRRFPQLTVIPAYVIGIGVRPERAPAFARRSRAPSEPRSTGQPG